MATLVGRSVCHYWRQHVGTVLGAAVSATVLVGALVVGDCVRGTLLARALARIGDVDLAIQSGDRLFRARLADDIVARAGVRACAVLSVAGVAGVPDGRARANDVAVHGVDDAFFGLSPGGTGLAPADGEVAINAALAGQLDASVGDTLVVRVERLTALPREAELSRADEATVAVRVVVSTILDDTEFGGFSLRSNQLAAFNAFFSRDFLARQLGIDDRANTLLVGGSTDIGEMDTIIKAVWQPADAELELRVDDQFRIAEVRSRRIFLDPTVEQAIAKIDHQPLELLTYFVTAIRTRDRSVPYSMVAAIGPGTNPSSDKPPGLASTPLRPTELNGIVLNDWTATELGITIGQPVSLEYLAFDDDGHLATRSHGFVVTGIVPIEGLAADQHLMPAFPGIATAESSRDWEPGLPIDLSLIRDEDEAYWKRHRGTPKGFIRLEDGRGLWGNSRFGSLTAVRVERAEGDELLSDIMGQLDPISMGLGFVDVRSRALAGASVANDFAMLFLSLSVFLIFSGVMLTTLLFVFTIQRRSREVGTLLAIGYRPATVRRLLTSESAILATVGSLLGGGLGLLYTKLVLTALATIWAGAAASAVIGFHITPGSFVIGVVGSMVASVLASWFAVRSQVRRRAIELLTGVVRTTGSGSGHRRGGSGPIAAGIAVVLGVAMAVMAATGDPAYTAGGFFAAGGLLLMAGFLLSRSVLIRIGDRQTLHGFSLHSLGMRNTVRRRDRSLATIALMACGTFLVVAVGLNRLDATIDADVRSSGTGGFALFGTTTVPVTRNLAHADGRRDYGLDGQEFNDVDIVPMRIRAGDDASCLNLGQAQNPQLVGIDPRQLADRQAFSFVDSEADDPTKSPWFMLEDRLPDGSIPAIGDQQSVRWALHKAVGDTLDYTDDRGKAFRVRIVGTVSNSILQGNLLIDQSLFKEQFPAEMGWRMFLIDTAPGASADIAAGLSRQLADVGLELTPAADRLARFNAVQNTYLSIFQILGGLGLLLGSAGLGMVVLRNVFERQGELATLASIGFRPGALRRLVISEHGLLLLLGLGCGAVSGLVAVLPALGRSGAQAAPLLSTGLIVLSVAIAGLAWVWIATWAATRAPLLQALRSE